MRFLCKTLLACALIAPALCLSSPLKAQSDYSAHLAPYNQGNPAGTGDVTLKLLDTKGDIFVSLTASNLYSNVQQVWISQGGPSDVSSSMALDLRSAPGLGSVSVGATSVSIQKTYTGADALWDGLKSGSQYYVAIASINYPFPKGGLRGQLSAVAPAPELGAFPAFTVGAMSLLFVWRRRRGR